jgi:hypothetical protein
MMTTDSDPRRGEIENLRAATEACSTMADNILADAGVRRIPLMAADRQYGWAWVVLRETPLEWEGQTLPFEVIKTELFDGTA